MTQTLFALPRIGNPIVSILAAAETARQRRALAGLPQERLADLGLTQDDVAQELARPLWQAPAHWRKI